MSKCEACGGDGQIEYGAYRGDEDGPTRECRLCGGIVTACRTTADVVSDAGITAQAVSKKLNRLAHMTSESGKRFTDLVITTAVSPSGKSQTWAREVEPHEHLWTERTFADMVEYECKCSAVAIFSRADGTLINPVDISGIDKLLLSSRTMTRFPLYKSESHQRFNTPKEHADARLEQLRQENERLQLKAEAACSTNDTMNRPLCN